MSLVTHPECWGIDAKCVGILVIGPVIRELHKYVGTPVNVGELQLMYLGIHLCPSGTSILHLVKSGL